MSKLESLKRTIEEERRVLDEMVGCTGAEDVLQQSRKIDALMEEYIQMTE